MTMLPKSAKKVAIFSLKALKRTKKINSPQIRISWWSSVMATPSLNWPHPFWLMAMPCSPQCLTSLRKSEYIRNFSNSNNILASRLHCRCSGWAWTILCNARPAFRRISGEWGFWLPPACRILTKMSTTWCCLIMVQLPGLEDMAKKVLDILSMSLLPSRDTRESTHSILVSMSSERWRKLTSLFKECTDDVKLITEAESSWKVRKTI